MPQFNDRLQQSRVAELHHREEEQLIQTLASQRGYQYVDLIDSPIDAGALRLIPENTARKAELAVFARANKNLSVAIRNPQNSEIEPLLTQLKEQGFVLELYMVSLHSLDHAWERYKDTHTATAETRGVLDVSPNEIKRFAGEVHSYLDVAEQLVTVGTKNSAERISKTIEVLFGGALALNASDIHIEPTASGVRIRYRIDGVLWDIADLGRQIYLLLISRLKLLSGLKLNVHTEAQDGRFTFDIGDRNLEVRSSIIPGAQGESMVMRLLDPDASGFTLEKLGLNARLHEVIEEELSRPNGALITTGPTGSGKTTALYAFLQKKHSAEVKIITIEDPVEYKLPGILQTQVTDEYTFELGLRSILRQDPDIIMVGEIRDGEVARTAVDAALTGHYVFSTLHTNSAVGAFPRLIDLGVDSRTIGSALNVVVGQRLVRRLCEHCKTQRDTTTEEQKVIARIMDEPVAIHTIYTAPGCDKCGGSGFHGRIGIYEAIVVDQAVEEVLQRDLRESVILEAARPQKIPSMQQDGVMKVLAGITSLDELSRVIDLYGKNVQTAVDGTSETVPEDTLAS